MVFDEYEYLENMVENPEVKKSEGKANGSDESPDKDSKRSSKHRGDVSDRPSKHSRSDRESRDDKGRSHRDRGERDEHRSSREHRDRDKEGGSGREKDRERDRETGNDRERRGRDYEWDRDREGEVERSRMSKGYPDRHRNARGRESSRERQSADKDFKERPREREFRDRNHDGRRKKDKKEGGEEPAADPERDQRTVFAYQITLKADERDVYEFFSRVGKVRDVRLITDRNTGRSKGVGYIEFVDVMSVPMAIALSGQPLLGYPVMVKPSEAEKNLVQSTAAASSGGLGPYSGGARRLYVGNLPNTIKEDQLRQVFEPFGIVELVQMPIDLITGNCKGYAFIQFARLEDAKLAQNLNGQLELAGQVIKVSAITDQAGMQDAGANMADLDDDEGNGLSLNAHSRALLMQKLDRTGTASSINGSFEASNGQMSAPMFGLTTTVLPGPPAVDPIGNPSECLLLKNMFDPSVEAEPGFDEDIKEDVGDECSKFGKLKHIYVDKNSAGFVYLRFENTQSAMGAQRALHGRWFAGKMITASFMLPQDYTTKFPDSS